MQDSLAVIASFPVDKDVKEVLRDMAMGQKPGKMNKETLKKLRELYITINCDKLKRINDIDPSEYKGIDPVKVVTNFYEDDENEDDEDDSSVSPAPSEENEMHEDLKDQCISLLQELKISSDRLHASEKDKYRMEVILEMNNQEISRLKSEVQKLDAEKRSLISTLERNGEMWVTMRDYQSKISEDIENIRANQEARAEELLEKIELVQANTEKPVEKTGMQRLSAWFKASLKRGLIYTAGALIVSPIKLTVKCMRDALTCGNTGRSVCSVMLGWIVLITMLLHLLIFIYITPHNPEEESIQASVAEYLREDVIPAMGTTTLALISTGSTIAIGNAWKVNEITNATNLLLDSPPGRMLIKIKDTYDYISSFRSSVVAGVITGSEVINNLDKASKIVISAEETAKDVGDKITNPLGSILGYFSGGREKEVFQIEPPVIDLDELRKFTGQ